MPDAVTAGITHYRDRLTRFDQPLRKPIVRRFGSEEITGPHDEHTSPVLAGIQQPPLHVDPNGPFASNGLLRRFLRQSRKGIGTEIVVCSGQLARGAHCGCGGDGVGQHRQHELHHRRYPEGLTACTITEQPFAAASTSRAFGRRPESTSSCLVARTDATHPAVTLAHPIRRPAVAAPLRRRSHRLHPKPGPSSWLPSLILRVVTDREILAPRGTKGIAQRAPTTIHLCMASDVSSDLYRSFLGVLKEGSLSGAARALDMRSNRRWGSILPR